MADSSRQVLSNRTVVSIAAVLVTGILLDGRIYNRTPPQQTIYSITNASEIKIDHQNQLIMAFKKQSHGWLLTQPATAPASTTRVEVLLDSNAQTSRSYSADDLPVEALFTDAVNIDIDGRLFTLGAIEPVSKLRYVMADNRVYLQADHVLPMLHAGTSAFVDLQVTGKVDTVTINNTRLPATEAWSNLTALGVLSIEKIASKSVASVTIEQHETTGRKFHLHRQDNISILVPVDSEFGYLISQQQAALLGLHDHI